MSRATGAVRTLVAAAAAIGVAAAVAPPAGASHFDGQAGSAAFNPQLSISLDAPIQGYQSDLHLRYTQNDHEALPRRFWLRIPAAFDLALGALRPSQQASGNPATSCSHPLGSPDQANLRHVERAEIMGSLRLVVATDVTVPRTTPIVWEGDSYLVNVSGGSAEFCSQITTGDQRVWDIYNTTGEDLRQLTLGAPLTRTGPWWEIFADLEDLVSDEVLQTVQASVWELSATAFGRTRGNWGDPVPFFLTPEVAFDPEPFDGERWYETFTFEAEFHSCRNRPPEDPDPCGSAARTNAPDVIRRPEVRIYPSRLPPVVTQPAPNAVLLGVDTLDLAWEPHPASYPADDPVRGISGWVVTVVPFEDAGAPEVAAVHAESGPCPAVALVCRSADDPIVPGVPEPDRGVVRSDPDGTAVLEIAATQDGWNVYQITTLYRDGTNSFDTDLVEAPALGRVRGPRIGQVYLAVREWPFVYLGTRGDAPVLLFLDTFSKEFSFVTIWWTAAGETPAMYFFQTGTQTQEGHGAFSHVAGPPSVWLPYDWSIHGTFDDEWARIVFHSQAEVWPLNLVRVGAAPDDPVGDLVGEACATLDPLFAEIQRELGHHFHEECPPPDTPLPPLLPFDSPA